MKKLFFTLMCLMGAYGAWAQCSASLTTTQSPFGNSLLTYDFNNTSSSSYSGPNYYDLYVLNYGDGSTASSLGYLSGHTYAATGTYNVSLAMQVIDSMTNSVVCSDTFFTTLNVSYTACGSIVSSMDMGSGVFDFTASIPAGTPTVSYSWNFGDGTSSSLQNPTHTYASPGVYSVTLTTFAGGCQYANTFSVVNGSNPIGCVGLNAGFTTSTSGNTVTFTNTSTPSSAPTVVMSYSWTFGDGNTSTSASPVHTYASGGVYYIGLHTYWTDTFNNSTCMDTTYQMMTVGTPPPPNYSLNGYIVFDSSLYPQSSFMVYLIQNDTFANTLTAVDSLITSGWSFPSFSFSNPAPGSYLVKAAPLGQTPGTAGMVPTYHDSSLYWNAASSIYFSGAGNVYGANIWMQNGTVTSGPGFVGGNISAGANKGTSSGVPGILVFLRNTSTGKMISSSVTDANGNYSFSNIPSGVYNVYPEDINHVTTPSSSYTVYSSGQVSYTDVNFLRNSTTIVPVTLGVSDVSSSSSVFALYPNPAQDQITISTERAATVTVSNVTGAKVMEMKVKAGGDKVSVEGLSNGVYLIRVSNGTASQTQKLMIQR